MKKAIDYVTTIVKSMGLNDKVIRALVTPGGMTRKNTLEILARRLENLDKDWETNPLAEDWIRAKSWEIILLIEKE